MRHALIIIAVVAITGSLVPPPAPAAVLRVQSDPPGASLKFGGVDSAGVAPWDTTVTAGSYRLESSFPRYQPLVHQFTVVPDDTLSLRFVLLAERPVRPTPEEVGLYYEPVVPLLLEEQADAVRRRYNAMAEVFAIVPLMQGVMAAIAVGGGNDYFSAELMVAGVCLSGGSYLLGKIMGKRKLSAIRRENELLAAQNELAKQHNKEVDLQIRSIHADAMRQWQAEAAFRGIVETSRPTE